MASKARKSAPKVDGYQVVTDQMIAMLEAGTVPWHQPWENVGGVPMSMSSKKAYRGINVLILQMQAMAKGYHSSWWGTYKQIAERGGQVRKGEKSTQVVLWRKIMIDNPDKPGTKKPIFLLRFFSVFNADQADGELGLPVQEPRPAVDTIAECETALAAYYLTGPTLKFGGDAAYYVPSQDHVQMPRRDQFESAEAFYGTWFHETTHSTGAATRLKREGVATMPAGHRFGDELYSKEELVAEMGSAFLAAHTGIAAKTLGESAGYIASWLKVLKNDKKMIIQAAAQAQKAVDMILGVVHVETSDDDSEVVSSDVTAAREAVAV
jgi:antirestriction protein ArdC